MVYVARKNGMVVHHTDLAAMRALDNIDKPEMELSDEAFEAAGGLVRLIDGAIFFGKTEAEKTAEANAERIVELKAKLTATDYIAAKIAEGSATAEDYADKIALRQAWRKEIAELEAAV